MITAQHQARADRGEHRRGKLELADGGLRQIEAAASKIEIQGGRYPEALEARTGL
jgi:hypothetical protein